MRKNKIEYPHPVLIRGKDDYIDCSFELLLDIDDFKTVGEEIIFLPKYTMECNGLTELLSKGKAKVVVIVQSSVASYRNDFAFQTNENSAEFRIAKNSVIKNIEFTGCIIANEDIKPFVLGELNPMYYKDSPQEVRKGDLLAIDNTIIFDLDDSELEKPISSIFNISKQKELEMMICPNYEGEKIEIQVLPEVFDIYYKLKSFNNGSFRRYLSAVVVLPVLTEAIDKMIGNNQCESDIRDDRMFEKRWYKSIEKKLKEHNIDLQGYNDSSVSLASKLLGDIVYDAMVSFKDTMDDEMGGSEIQRIGGDD